MVRVMPLLILMPLEVAPVGASRVIASAWPFRSRVRVRSMVSWAAPLMTAESWMLPAPAALAAVCKSTQVPTCACAGRAKKERSRAREKRRIMLIKYDGGGGVMLNDWKCGCSWCFLSEKGMKARKRQGSKQRAHCMPLALYGKGFFAKRAGKGGDVWVFCLTRRRGETNPSPPTPLPQGERGE